MRTNKVLVIAPHMDDEVLGCGGIIARHAHNNECVWVIFIAHRTHNHRFNQKKNVTEKKHALKAKAALDYKEAIFLDLSDERLDASVQEIIMPLERHIKAIRPQIVYVSFCGDNNQDHRAVFEASRVVLRPSATPFIKKVYMYEIPSSTEQSPPLLENAFLPNCYVDITNYMHKKLKAYRAYRTEKRVYPHPRSEKALLILAERRGIEIGFKYAEAFMVLREKWE